MRARRVPPQPACEGEACPSRGSLPATLLILIALCGLPGCALHESTVCGVSACPATGPAPRVEIFRGLGGYMPGSDDLQRRLACRGITSSAWCNESAHGVSRRILARRACGDTSPIVLMGYAVGGCGARRVANDLAEHGVCVDAIILIDPSFFEPVPCNVRYCFVAYKPEVCQMWNPIMRGNPVRVESTATAVRLVNLEEMAPPGAIEGECHLTLTTNAWIQELLVRQAAAAVGMCGHDSSGAHAPEATAASNDWDHSSRRHDAAISPADITAK